MCAAPLGTVAPLRLCRTMRSRIDQSGPHHARLPLASPSMADIFVAEDMNDATMVRVYARENATQRGQSSTALTGIVAAAMRYVAKAILTRSAEEFLSTFSSPDTA